MRFLRSRESQPDASAPFQNTHSHNRRARCAVRGVAEATGSSTRRLDPRALPKRVPRRLSLRGRRRPLSLPRQHKKGAWRGRVSGGCLRAAPCCTAPKCVALKRINSRGTFPLVATDAADSRRVRLSQHVKSRKNNCRAPRRLTACQTRSEPP